MDKKELINKLILDLAQDAPMSKVMLMAQAVSFELQNNLFSDWVRKERRGYDKCKDNEIPSYREVSCILKVDIFIPFRGMVTNFTVPEGVIKDPRVKKFVTSIKLPQSLSELEEIQKNNVDSTLRLGVPSSIFPYIDSVLNNGTVQGATRMISSTTPSLIINRVKAKMLDYFSFMSKQVDMDADFRESSIQTQLDNLFDTYIWNG